ncbi:hypothetical protein ACQPYH_06380 [Kribbella sp. CA-245084]|uniref:hypothetical protein n=1 Tax=Kribbella sp. CA-245084 TaxID=3239940 RepID=UPI003D9331CE
MMLDGDVAAAVAEEGFAQLVFDDYGHAIRRSQGGALHSMLYRLLVDSQDARDIGALLIARSGDMLDLNFAGSPLLSRAEMVSLPSLSEEDALAVGVPFGDLRRQAGDSTWLARRFLARSAHEARLSVVEHLNNDRRRIAAALPAGAVEVLVGARAYREADPVSQEALRCLGSQNGDTEFELAALVAESRLLEEIRLSSPGWPASRGESVRRFASLLAGADDAIWVDRYAFSRPTITRRFLDELRKFTTARLRILVSRDHDHPTLAAEIAADLDGVTAVEVRFMARFDRHHLHDRHLVLPVTKSGFIMPTAGVILGEDDPGSAVSVALPALPIDYAACWQRGARVFPV